MGRVAAPTQVSHFVPRRSQDGWRGEVEGKGWILGCWWVSEQTLRGGSQEGPPQPHPGVGRVRRKRKAEARKVLVVLPAAS